MAQPILGARAYTKRWFKSRRKTVGASEAAAVLGMSKWRQPLDVYQSKIDGDQVTPNKAMKRGHDFEAQCLKMYSDRVGGSLYDKVPMLIHPDHEFMSATPDAIWINDLSVKGKSIFAADYIPVEAKTTESMDEWGAEGTSEIPTDYVIQAQQHMAVTDTARCDVPVLFGFPFKLYVVERNEDIIAALVDAEKELIERVANEDPPEINWEHPRTPELVKRMYEVTEAVIELSDEMCERWLEMEGLRDQRGKLDKQIELIKAEATHEMGAAGIARMRDGRELVRKKQRREAYSVEARDVTSLRCRKQK